jgi:hypothetical protein
LKHPEFRGFLSITLSRKKSTSLALFRLLFRVRAGIVPALFRLCTAFVPAAFRLCFGSVPRLYRQLLGVKRKDRQDRKGSAKFQFSMSKSDGHSEQWFHALLACVHFCGEIGHP